MMEVIKGILKKVAGFVTETKGPYRTYNADGRPNETLRGKFIQHYGFASSPTEGTENVVLEYGNNSISIAENPGRGGGGIAGVEGSVVDTLKPGEVLLYNPDNDKGSVVYLGNPETGKAYGIMVLVSGDIGLIASDEDISLSAVKGNVTIEADKDVVVLSTTGNICLGSGLPSLLKKLVNDTFMALYNAHTHTAPGGTTGVPVVAMTSANLTSTTQAI